jgi:hypothetical protein
MRVGNGVLTSAGFLNFRTTVEAVSVVPPPWRGPTGLRPGVPDRRRSSPVGESSPARPSPMMGAPESAAQLQNLATAMVEQFCSLGSWVGVRKGVPREKAPTPEAATPEMVRTRADRTGPLPAGR